ncbi:MAG: flagellar hook-associated protein FlgL [Sulfuricella sp.]
MRISTSTLYDLGVSSIQKQSSALVKQQQMVSTGRRILTPADDPVGAARVLEVSQSKALNQQYDVNAGSATSSLGLEETALASVGSLIQDVKTIAINAGNPTLDHNNLASLATDLRGRYQELLGIANSTDGNGQYMFSGYKGSTQPFSETSPGNVAYNGDQGQRLIQISASRQIAVSDAGSDAFQQIKNGNGTFVTAAGAGNTGTGLVSPGSVLDPAKWAAVTDKNLSIKFAVDSTVTPPVTTYDIVDSTNTSILGGAGTPPYPRTYTSGSTISLKSQGAEPPFDYGVELSIENAPADGDTFSVKASTNESIFTTLNNLITSLETGSGTGLANDLNTALSNLDNDLNRVLTVRASVGSRMKEIESVKSTGGDLALQYDQTLSDLQDLDYAKAISDLTRNQLGLQAAQQSFVKIQGLSLFNYIQ